MSLVEIKDATMFGFLKRKAAAPEARVPDGVRVYAIGDIHGRLDLLERLQTMIEQDWSAAPADAGRFIYLGDYVDRGSNTAGVIETLCRGSAGPLAHLDTTFLGGNHEEMLLAFLSAPSAGTEWRHLGGLETMYSYRVDVAKVLAERGFDGLSAELQSKMPVHHLEFLNNLELSTRIGDYFFCHAGVRPGIPLGAQTARDLKWIRDEFLFSNADFGAVIVHGHSPADKPEVRANRINIDTGAYATGRLTCLVLEGNSQRFLYTR